MAKRNIVSPDNFDMIYWDGLAEAMQSYPQMVRVDVMKHVSHFQGMNRQLSRDVTQGLENVCPCCGRCDESTGHITHCTDEGRTEMFEESVDILADFLSETHMDGRLIDCIVTYLLQRGEQSMSSIVHRMPLFLPQ
eukprot:scaffold85772_cov22-Cyclotella_meneghiniana.AAC.3